MQAVNKEKSLPTCVICKDRCLGYGHNPRPLMNHGVCCNICNLKVIEARMRNQFHSQR